MGQAEVKTANRDKLERLGKGIEELAPRVGALVVGLSQEQFLWKPKPAVWSMAQCIEHMSVALEQYLVPIRAAHAEAVSASLSAPKRSVFDPLVAYWVRSVAPPVRQKIPAPKIFRPRSTLDAADVSSSVSAVLGRFTERHHEVRELIAKLDDDRRLYASRVAPPFFKLVTMPLGQALWLVLNHAHRHIEQLERLKQSLPPL